LGLFTGTKMFAVRAESCSSFVGSACNPVLLSSTLWPRRLLQIRVGSTLHPFRTTAPDGLALPLCEPHPPITAEMKRIKNTKRSCI